MTMEIVVNQPEFDEQLVRLLEASHRPLRTGEVWNSLPDDRPSADTVSKVLLRLADAGRIVRTGVRAGTRFQCQVKTDMPAPLPPAASVATPAVPVVDTPPPAPPAETRQVVSTAIANALDAALSAGASVAPKELVRRLRVIDPAVDETFVARVLEQLAEDGHVARLVTEGGRRYRKVAGRKVRGGPREASA